MTNVKIGINALASEVTNALREYANIVPEEMKAVANKVSRNAVKDLKSSSPTGRGSRKGHYGETWGVTVQSQGSQSIELIIHNKKKPGLTHLLEKGHAKRGGGRVAARVHIAPVEQRAIAEYEQKLKERLSR